MPVALVLAPMVSFLERSCESFCVGLDFSELVGTLALVFSENLESRGSGDNGFTIGNEVVAAVSVFYFYNVVLVSKAVDVFFEYDFHILSGFKGYFIRSVT